MLACPACHRFVRDDGARCPFCDAALVADRAPLGGFLGVLLGISLAACGGDDEGDTNASESASQTMTASTDGSTSDDMTTGDDMSSASEVTGPLYGPVTFDTSGGETSGGSEDESTSGTDSGSTSGSTDSGDSTTLDPSETAGPLYGPATSN